MTEKKYRVHDWVKFQYSEIGEYTDENHTDKPLRNDEVVELLNELHEENMELKCKSKMIYERDAYKKLYESLQEENKQLKQYKKAVWDCDSSKIIRVNKNTGEVDLIDKKLKE